MSILEKVSNLKQVWALFMKNTPPPGDDVLAQWALDYSPTELEYAISRTSKKAHNQPMDTTATHRYCGGVFHNECKEPQRRIS